MRPNIVRFAFLIALPRSATLHAVVLRRNQRLTASIHAICAVSGILTGSYPPQTVAEKTRRRSVPTTGHQACSTAEEAVHDARR
jgi:hypothetical protein